MIDVSGILRLVAQILFGVGSLALLVLNGIAFYLLSRHGIHRGVSITMWFFFMVVFFAIFTLGAFKLF